jgi:hypothetical protein
MIVIKIIIKITMIVGDYHYNYLYHYIINFDYDSDSGDVA